MSLSFLFFIILQFLALAYFLEALRRIRKRVKEYPLQDSSETLPFGFLKLRYVIFIYIASYLLWVLVSFWLYFSWGNDFFSRPLSTPSETLNL